MNYCWILMKINIEENIKIDKKRRIRRNWIFWAQILVNETCGKKRSCSVLRKEVKTDEKMNNSVTLILLRKHLEVVGKCSKDEYCQMLKYMKKEK